MALRLPNSKREEMLEQLSKYKPFTDEEIREMPLDSNPDMNRLMATVARWALEADEEYERENP